jgi:exodeoxyribonuclease VII large subunit
VRLRGELSKVTHHGNGHVYLTIKDDKAAIDGVVWKGNRCAAWACGPSRAWKSSSPARSRPIPAGSRYQIVIDTMEAAGVGALLAQLERLKAKLHGEGLFDARASAPCPRCRPWSASSPARPAR